MNESTTKLNTKGASSAFDKLKRLNMLSALLLAAQAVVLVIIANKDSGERSITSSFTTQDKLLSNGTGHNVFSAATHQLFNLNLVYVVAVFLLVAAVSEVLIVTMYKKTYQKDLARGVNRLRWALHGLSTGLVFATIAMTVGILDLGTLVLVFGLGWLVSMLGLSMEAVNQNADKPYWLSYKLAGAASLVVWVVLALTVWSDHTYGTNVPGYIYGVFFSMLVLFAGNAVIMRKQNQKRGKWADYLRAEKAYLLLGFVIKTALAWQIYVGTLR